VRVLRCVSLLAISFGLVGCQAFGKKSQGAPNNGTRPGPAAVPPRLGQPVSPRADATSHNPAGVAAVPAGVTGILAGQVIDSYNRPPPITYIQVTAAPEPNDSGGAPISREVEVTNQGYFTIEGLQPGRHYQLLARSKDGERVLAGRTWATPPNPKVLIRISEDFAGNDMPPVPGTPAIPRPRNDSAWAPYRGPNNGTAPNANSSKPGELGRPVPGGSGTQPPQTNVRPEGVADNQVARTDPLVEIRPRASSPSGPAPVPSCVLTGRQLYNLALNDLSGRPWEYRSHRGRLVLIDFWGSWCIPCLQSVPHLTDLQQRYGGYGLEIVGVAYEQGGSWPEQVQRVDRVRQRLRINYRLLLGSGSQCPVQTQFQIASLPTLVLVDESDQIIWRHEGGLDRARFNELETIVKRQLGMR